ncbi:MAG: hypothetical protein AAFN04_08390 [Pseudomonadota bacterium]
MKLAYRLLPLLLPLAGAAQAQSLVDEPEIRAFTDEEIAAVEMPTLGFDMRKAKVKDFKKYYYFHRDETSFDEAFADLTECDALSSGLTAYRGDSEPYAGYYVDQYGMAGVVGGVIGSAIGNAIADALYGSSERRALRRINMRNCMGYKGYQRYGLPKKLWKTFNFEEGGGREDEDVREAALLKQAKVGSGAKPQQEVLER